ncbi:MAG: hypothetical protein ACREXR_15850, partial [Gammaproteobacteria bacterium]
MAQATVRVDSEKRRDAPGSPTGLVSPGLDELPHRTGKGCELVDNSPAAKQGACRGQRFALPTAHPLPTSSSPQSIFIFFEERNIQGLGRG